MTDAIRGIDTVLVLTASLACENASLFGAFSAADRAVDKARPISYDPDLFG